MDCASSPRASVIEIENNVETNQVEQPSETISSERNNQRQFDESIQNIFNGCFQWLKKYIQKFSGLHENRPNRLSWDEHFWSFMGSLISIILIAILHYKLLEKRQLFFLSGSFGASAVIVFCNFRSPVAQPRNLIGGHLIGATTGCIMRITIDRFEHSVACALAIAIAIVVMQFTETLHPPGGATALIAVTIQPTLPWANFLFIFIPTLTGACIILIVALVINNIPSKRVYPCFWW